MAKSWLLMGIPPRRAREEGNTSSVEADITIDRERKNSEAHQWQWDCEGGTSDIDDRAWWVYLYSTRTLHPPLTEGLVPQLDQNATQYDTAQTYPGPFLAHTSTASIACTAAGRTFLRWNSWVQRNVGWGISNTCKCSLVLLGAPEHPGNSGVLRSIRNICIFAYLLMCACPVQRQQSYADAPPGALP